MPPGIVKGELLLHVGAFGAAPSVSYPSDWQVLRNIAEGTVCKGVTGYKVAQGNDTLTLTHAAADCVHRVLRLTDINTRPPWYINNLNNSHLKSIYNQSFATPTTILLGGDILWGTYPGHRYLALVLNFGIADGEPSIDGWPNQHQGAAMDRGYLASGGSNPCTLIWSTNIVHWTDGFYQGGDYDVGSSVDWVTLTTGIKPGPQPANRRTHRVSVGGRR